MKKILLAEATLSRETSLSFKEKLEAAKLLDALKVDIIDTCAVLNEKADEILVKTVAAQTAKSIVSCPVLDDKAEKAWAAVSTAAKPRLNVKLPVSISLMEYTCKKKPPKMLEYITACVSAAKALCADVEFTALDATRAEDDFLYTAVKTAIAAGADTVTFTDEAGDMMPAEFGEFIAKIVANVPELEGKTVGVCASDRLSMAEACAFEAVKAGATLVYATASGSNMPSLNTWVEIMRTKGEKCGIECDADITSIERTCGIINGLSKTRFATEIHERAEEAPSQVLDKNSDINTVAKAAEKLGYDLSASDIAKVFEHFSAIVTKKSVDMKELDAVIASVALQVPPTYTLSSFVINSGNIITATANVVLDRNGEKLSGISTGDGPIDAAIQAIEKLIGHHYEMDDFRLQSVTGGREAMGEALVRLRDGGKLYSGRGTSTDIVGASIRAYINALNKVVYKD